MAIALYVLYSFELVILGVLVLGAMCVCGVVMWWRNRGENDSRPTGMDTQSDDAAKR